jgi:hypothetical protein
MTETLKASCLCGGVEYEVRDPDMADWHEIGGDAPQFAENPPG